MNPPMPGYDTPVVIFRKGNFDDSIRNKTVIYCGFQALKGGIKKITSVVDGSFSTINLDQSFTVEKLTESRFKFKKGSGSFEMSKQHLENLCAAIKGIRKEMKVGNFCKSR